MNFIIAGCHCCQSLIYCIAGYNSSASPIRDTDAYNAGADSWSASTDIVLPARIRHCISSIAGALINFFGANSSFTPIADVDSFSAGSWVSKTDYTTAKQGARCGTIGGLAYVYGGWAGGGSTHYQDCDEYDASGDSFSSMSAMPTPANRIDNCGTAIAGEAYSIVGGFTTNIDDVDAYDPTGDSWSAKASAPAARGSYPAIFTISDLGYMCGGTVSGSASNACIEYDPSADSWTSMTNMTSAAYATAGESSASSGFVFSGQTTGGSFMSSVQEYSQSGDSWSAASAIPTPNRGYHGAGAA